MEKSSHSSRMDYRRYFVKKNRWLQLLLLITLLFLLSGCGVDHAGVDVMHTAPDGFWQTLVVWPLAKALIFIDAFLRDLNIPFHWGFSIIAFTVILRLLLFPLTLSQIRGMQAQKELQPKIQELQKKYGKDREKITQEQMKLYQEAGVNPLSGCLPLVIQMPILFGLYSALVAIGQSLEGANFFWIPDLSFPKYSQGLGWISEAFQAGNYGLLVSYLILPALLIVSQFFMQKWMTPPTPTTGDNNSQAGMMKQMTYVMTFMFGFFTLQVPAGLTLYWVTSNLLQMGQQWLTTSGRFNLGAPKPAVAGAGAGSASSASLSQADRRSSTDAETAASVKASSPPKRRKRKK
ncbi:MAG: YidC/Oxa1 family membrane protein insertase [Caldilineaceae bacterium]